MDGLLTIDYPVDFTTYVKKRIVTIGVTLWILLKE